MALGVEVLEMIEGRAHFVKDMETECKYYIVLSLW